MSQPELYPNCPYKKLESYAAKFAGCNVVLAGCGGGCDVYGTTVLYHMLKPLCKGIAFTNFSFSTGPNLRLYAEKLSHGLYRVNPGVKVQPGQHFAEAHLATALGVPVYAIPVSTLGLSIQEAYKTLFKPETLAFSYDEGQPAAPDAIILTDGGCDVLLTGEETGLATFVEDMQHLRAITALSEVPIRHVAAVGPNIDCGHGVIQAELDKRLKDLHDSGAMLMAHGPMVLGKDPAADFFAATVAQCDPVRTIVQSLVVAAMQGHRGLYTPDHLKARIGTNRVPLTDQTASIYVFELKDVAAEVLYLSYIPENGNLDSVAAAFQEYQAENRNKVLAAHAKKK